MSLLLCCTKLEICCNMIFEKLQQPAKGVTSCITYKKLSKWTKNTNQFLNILRWWYRGSTTAHHVKE